MMTAPTTMICLLILLATGCNHTGITGVSVTFKYIPPTGIQTSAKLIRDKPDEPQPRN